MADIHDNEHDEHKPIIDDEYHFTDTPETDIFATPEQPLKQRQSPFGRRAVLMLIALAILGLILYKLFGWLSSYIAARRAATPTTQQVVGRPTVTTPTQSITAQPGQAQTGQPGQAQPEQAGQTQPGQAGQAQPGQAQQGQPGQAQPGQVGQAQPGQAQPDQSTQITAMQGQISDENNSLATIQNSLTAINNQLQTITSTLQSQQAQINALKERAAPRVIIKARPVRVPVVRVPVAVAPPPPPPPQYFVQAMIPGRAWLVDENGGTITVSLGDNIASYGIIRKIDPGHGVVITSSGAIFRYLGN